jgi:hypothetical protein
MCSRNYARLELLEGKDGAAELIDGKLIRETTDKYGRVAYIYSQDMASRVGRKKKKVELASSMALNASLLLGNTEHFGRVMATSH